MSERDIQLAWVGGCLGSNRCIPTPSHAGLEVARPREGGKGLLAGVAMENISADPGEKAYRASRRDMSSLTP